MVAAGIAPSLVALLGRWESFKAALPGGVPNSPLDHWKFLIMGLARLVAGLAARSPAARRQLRDGGAAPLLRAIAADAALESTVVADLCREAVRCLDAA